MCCNFSTSLISGSHGELMFRRSVEEPSCANSHGGRGELLLGVVERVVEHGDAAAPGLLLGRQVAPQNSVVSDAEEGHHAVPRLVVEPHLPG